jgi:adenosylcobinamide-GDP ribazoletransferase
MAPNNGLSRRKRSSSRSNTTRGKTTILRDGLVESRGTGTNINSRFTISTQVQNFIDGEGSFTTKTEARAFFTVWTFVTRLPGPIWVDHHPGYLMLGMSYFPFAGCLIGIFVSVFFDVADLTLKLPLYTSSVIAEAASLWLTGCFHEDGLADSADGIGGGWSKDQILTIMTDTRLGTYGCAVLLLYIVAKLQLLTSLGSSAWIMCTCTGAGPALIVAHTLARLTSPMLIKSNDYIDEHGPKQKYYSFMIEAKHLVSWPRVIFALITSYIVAYSAYGNRSAVILIAAVIIIVILAGKYANYLLGGVMGDYLGATICITEISLLIVLLLLRNISEHILLLRKFSLLSTQFLNGTESFTAILSYLSTDQAMMSLMKFLIISLFTCLWCANVGHPPVFLRNEVVANNKNDEDADDSDGDIRIALAYKKHGKSC